MGLDRACLKAWAAARAVQVTASSQGSNQRQWHSHSPPSTKPDFSPVAGWAGLLHLALQRAGRTHTTSQCSSAGARSCGSHRSELLAAGCVLLLQSQQGQWRCNLVNPAQRTEDLILCPYMPLVITQLLLLTWGNMFVTVPGHRTKKTLSLLLHQFSFQIHFKCSNFYRGAICFSPRESKGLPTFHHFWAWRAAYQKITSMADT